MNQSMRAAVYKGNQTFQIETFSIPELQPNQVLIKVKYSGICGTDVHAFQYDIAPVGTVLGHEYSGDIVVVGTDVTKFKIGDRVIGTGGNPPKNQGPGFLWKERFNFKTMGYSSNKKRGYADYVVTEDWEPIQIPMEVTYLQAALCEPCGVAIRAIRASNFKLGDTVAIFGGGPIGMLMLQVAKAAGASKIIATEISPARIDSLYKLGADKVVNPVKENVVAAIEDFTKNKGVNIAFECAGVGETLDQALNAVSHSGQVMLVALSWEPIPITPVNWAGREVKMQTTFGAWPMDYKLALDFISKNKINVDSLVTTSQYINLENIQETFESLIKPKNELKVVIRMN
jgi:(R,R)-butanediol dehydrogenase/meso-butanediol dehydrogenase/diacetyl reductase